MYIRGWLLTIILSQPPSHKICTLDSALSTVRALCAVGMSSFRHGTASLVPQVAFTLEYNLLCVPLLSQLLQLVCW